MVPKYRFLTLSQTAVLVWHFTLCSSENYSAALLDNGGSSPITKKYSEKCRENLKWLEEWYQINPISVLLRIYHVFHSAWVLLSAFRLLGLWVKDTFPVPCGNLSPESQRHFRYLNSSSSELVAPLESGYAFSLQRPVWFQFLLLQNF